MVCSGEFVSHENPTCTPSEVSVVGCSGMDECRIAEGECRVESGVIRGTAQRQPKQTRSHWLNMTAEAAGAAASEGHINWTSVGGLFKTMDRES